MEPADWTKLVVFASRFDNDKGVSVNPSPSPSCCFNQGVTFNMLALELSIGG